MTIRITPKGVSKVRFKLDWNGQSLATEAISFGSAIPTFSLLSVLEFYLALQISRPSNGLFGVRTPKPPLPFARFPPSIQSMASTSSAPPHPSHSLAYRHFRLAPGFDLIIAFVLVVHGWRVRHQSSSLQYRTHSFSESLLDELHLVNRCLDHRHPNPASNISNYDCCDNRFRFFVPFSAGNIREMETLNRRNRSLSVTVSHSSSPEFNDVPPPPPQARLLRPRRWPRHAHSDCPRDGRHPLRRRARQA